MIDRRELAGRHAVDLSGLVPGSPLSVGNGSCASPPTSPACRRSPPSTHREAGRCWRPWRRGAGTASPPASPPASPAMSPASTRWSR
ncbi:hypothetical protein ACFQ0B_49295 [Nonomuraea thailandensis]